MFARACTLWCRISLYVRIKIITTRSCAAKCARGAWRGGDISIWAVRPVSSRGRGVGRAARSTGVAGARTRHPTRDGPHWCEYKSSLDPGHKPTVLGRCLG